MEECPKEENEDGKKKKGESWKGRTKQTIIDNGDSNTIKDVGQRTLIVSNIILHTQPTRVIVVVNKGSPKRVCQ